MASSLASQLLQGIMVLSSEMAAKQSAAKAISLFINGI
jgi:hypothetical protein